MKLILTVGWIVTLVAAFGLGRSMLPGGTQDTVTPALSDAIDSNDFLIRMYSFAKSLEGLNPDNIDANLAVFEKSYLGMSDTEVRAFVFAWARFDPEAALSWARRWRAGLAKSKLVRIALWAWGSIDPQGAVDALNKLPPAKRNAADYRMELIRGWIRGGDAAGATEYVLSSGSSRQNTTLVSRMAVWIARDGVDPVIDWADAIPESEENAWAKEAGYQAAIGEVAKLDTARAAAWYEANRESEHAEAAMKTLAFAWVTNTNPVTLFDWLQEQPAGQLRLETIRQSYRRWLKHDPEEAMTWIQNTELTAALDPAVAVFARLESQINPESAVEWANRIEDQAMQRLTIVPILRIWAREDSVAARNWMIEHNFPEAIRDDILARLPMAALEQLKDMDMATGATTAAP